MNRNFMFMKKWTMGLSALPATIIFKHLLNRLTIKAKLYVEHCKERGMKGCHMTKMAAMVINSRNL